jgi:hypothetical protein
MVPEEALAFHPTAMVLAPGSRQRVAPQARAASQPMALEQVPLAAASQPMAQAQVPLEAASRRRARAP